MFFPTPPYFSSGSKPRFFSFSISFAKSIDGQPVLITISGSSSLDEAEVERLREEAEKYAEDDKLKKDQVVSRNELDTMVYQAEKQLTELGDKVPGDLKSSVEDAVAKAKKALEDEGASGDSLKEAKDSLMQSLEAVGKQVYEDVGPPEGDPAAAGAVPGADGPAASEEPAKDEDIVEADFEVVDEGKDKS